MVAYWDSSAVVPLILKETKTELYLRLARELGITTWWGTYVECFAAIARHSHTGGAMAQVSESYRMLDQLAEEWIEISANPRVRQAAVRALRNHDLRAGDALQLGAAQIAGGFEPHLTRFVTADLRLRRAAEREGFIVE